MKRWLLLAAFCVGFLATPELPAFAAGDVAICAPGGTGNCILPNSDGSINAGLNAGAGIVTNPGSVTSASEADGANVTLGAKADAAWSSGSGSAIAILKAAVNQLVTATISLGQKTSANSLSTVPASDAGNWPTNVAQINGVTPLMGQGKSGTGSPRVTIADINAGIYKTIAASQTAQTLGTGATGDYLQQLICTPTSTSPGVVTILDNATSISLFAGGASSLSNLAPLIFPINAYSVSGAWKVTTGASISCVATGNFTP